LVSLIIINTDKNFTKIIDILGQIEENSVNSGGTRVPTDINKEVIFVFRDFRSIHLNFILYYDQQMHDYLTN